MSLKKSKGNMYDWVTNMHNHLGGECPHKCSYCYVQRNKFGVNERYKGEIRFVESELKVDYGKNKIIFIEYMSDMFAGDIPVDWIRKIFYHCNRYPDNNYVFQTKNPNRAYRFIDLFPQNFMIGTTIESNRTYKNITKAPEPIKRYEGMFNFSGRADIFITIEPILEFDVDILVDWLKCLRPTFINIGADSKGCNLPEPSGKKVKEFIGKLQENGIIIRKKTNLKRILREMPV